MDWKYIAGYFDADGNFHIIYNKKKKSFALMVRIYSTQMNVLKSIQKFVGFGNIYTKSRNNEWNILYEYTIIKKSETKYFLIKISPYLIVKKAQGDFLLDNFNFDRGFSNIEFDVDRFRSFITRKGVKRINGTLTHRQLEKTKRRPTKWN